jgi:hypothetical protein
VVASALGIPALLPFLKAVCLSKKSWQARHTGIKIVQQIAILMGCAVLPHLKALVDIIKHGLKDENQKVRAGRTCVCCVRVVCVGVVWCARVCGAQSRGGGRGRSGRWRACMGCGGARHGAPSAPTPRRTTTRPRNTPPLRARHTTLQVKTITALSLAALAEASSPYGIESFDDVLEPLWRGIR